MTWTNPSVPNLPDYIDFVHNTMMISPLIIPSTSPYLGYSLNQALGIVINVPAWCGPSWGSLPGYSGDIGYILAVYNCAGHIQITITPDQPMRTDLEKLRKQFKLLDPYNGVVESSSDQGTAESLAIPDSLRNLSLIDLDMIRTPYGRTALAWNQNFGSGVFGLS